MSFSHACGSDPATLASRRLVIRCLNLSNACRARQNREYPDIDSGLTVRFDENIPASFIRTMAALTLHFHVATARPTGS